MPFGLENINTFYGLGKNINWHDICKDLTDNQAHWNTPNKGELTWFPFSLLTLSAKIWFYLVITRLCPNLNASKVTKEKALYVYVIEHDISFDITRVINEDILEQMERAVNTTLGFLSLITELCQQSQVTIKENKEKTP